MGVFLMKSIHCTIVSPFTHHFPFESLSYLKDVKNHIRNNIISVESLSQILLIMSLKWPYAILEHNNHVLIVKMTNNVVLDVITLH